MNHHDMANMDMSEPAAFCHMPATNMLPGLMTVMQATKAISEGAVTHGGGTCLVFLFYGVVMDTPVKYAFGIVGAFLMAFALEGVRCLQRKSLMSYLVMLLAMTFEAIFLLAVVLGLGAGHLSFHLLPSLGASAPPDSAQVIPSHHSGPSTTSSSYLQSKDLGDHHQASSITIVADTPGPTS